MNKKDKLTYIRPVISVVELEIQQGILAGSQPGQIEGLGGFGDDDIEWTSGRTR